MYFSFNSFIKGSLIRGYIGARIPLSNIVLSRICFDSCVNRTLAIPLLKAEGFRRCLRLRAMKGESSYGNAPLEAHGSTGGAFRDWDDLPTPHGTPTSFAIAEYPPDPIGAPYSHSVEVLDSLLPSLFSISNLCWSMTRSITEYYSLRFREI